MNITSMKWIVAIIPAICIGIFEFVRHEFLYIISMEWGNVLVALLTGIIFLIFSHGIFAFMENLYGKLQQKKQETAVLQERYRIAHNLHDSIAQSLFFMNVKLSELENTCKNHKEPWNDINDLREAIRFADSELRQNIFTLQNVLLEKNVDLVKEIKTQLLQYEQQTGTKTIFDVKMSDNEAFCPYECKKILHVFKELLLNIRKHASATQVIVILNKTHKEFTMIIKDNGKGFIHKQYGEKSLGYKLLKKDLQELKASIEINSTPQKGTTVKIVRKRLNVLCR